jgi:hypothetical protein
MPGAAEAINAFFAAREIPLQIPAEQVLFGIHRFSQTDEGPSEGEGAEYEITLCLETPSENHVQGLAAIISMMRLFMTGAFEADDPFNIIMSLFALPPVRNGTDLILHSGPLDAAEIALLFNLFSLYSTY